MTTARRPALLGVAALGLLLLAVPVATGLFGKATAVDRFNDDLRPVFGDASLDRLAADVAELQSVSDELHDEALPTLAAGTGRTDEELHRDLAAELPAFTAGADHLDATLARLRQVHGLLRAQQGNFRQEDRIPTASLPMVAVPVLFVASGVGLLALALLAATGRLPRALPPALTVLAVVVAIVPLAWGIPGKARAVDDLTGALRPTLGAEAVADSRVDVDEAEAMVGELRADALPAFAADLGLTDAQFGALVAEQFPAIDAALPRLDAVFGRLDRLVATAEANVGRFQQADALPTAGTPTVVLPWLLVGPAAAAALLAGGTTVAAWSRRARPSSARAPAPGGG